MLDVRWSVGCCRDYSLCVSQLLHFFVAVNSSCQDQE